MTHAGSLRGGLARLVASGDTKLSISSMAQQQLNNALKAASSEMTRTSKELTSNCHAYNSSDAAYAKRERSRSISGIATSRLGTGGRSYTTPVRKDLKYLGVPFPLTSLGNGYASQAASNEPRQGT